MSRPPPRSPPVPTRRSCDCGHAWYRIHQPPHRISLNKKCVFDDNMLGMGWRSTPLLKDKYKKNTNRAPQWMAQVFGPITRRRSHLLIPSRFCSGIQLSHIIQLAPARSLSRLTLRREICNTLIARRERARYSNPDFTPTWPPTPKP